MKTVNDAQTPINYQLEEEIDLRRYVAILIKYWYWIVGLAIIAAVVGFVVSSILPLTYEATALVTATQPRYQLQFDERYQNIPEWDIQQLLLSQYRTYPTLATSDELMQQLAQQTGWPLDDLKRAVEANGGNDPGLLMLEVKGEDPEAVANVANIWATLFVEKVEALYGNSRELEQFNRQQQLVAQDLAEAEAALTAFRQENGFGFDSDDSSSSQPMNEFGLIGQRLQSKNQLLTNYEAELISLRQMAHEVELLSKSITAETSPALIAGLLAEMINTGIVGDSQPYQIEFDSLEPGPSLAAMATALESRATAIEVEMDGLRDDIADLQAELAAKQEQLEGLIRKRDVKAEAYAVISRKVQEAQIDNPSEGSNAGKVKIASRATVPTEPVSRGRLLSTIVAGTLGLIAGVIGVFALEWWRMDVTFGGGEQHLQPSTFQATVER